MRRKESGTTEYSKDHKGTKRNYDRVVRFDATDGYVGVTQWAEGHIERVLLSPEQARALAKWISAALPETTQP